MALNQNDGLRQENRGLRKACGCPRRKWAKCDHPWHFNFQWKGKGYRFSLDRHLGRRVRSKTEAETETERIRIAIKDGTFDAPKPVETAPPVARPTFATVAKAHAERRARGRRVAGGVDSFLSSVTVPGADGRPVAFTDKAFDQITTDDIDRVIAAKATTSTVVMKKGEKEWTRTVGGEVAANRLYAYLRELFNWAVDKGYAERSPCYTRSGKRAIPAYDEHARRRRLEDGEAARLLAAAGPHLNDLIVSALETGCRLGELLSLQWSQVRWLQNEVFLPGVKTKSGRDRAIPISPTLRGVLTRRQKDADGRALPPTAFVFGNEVGERVASIKTAWRGACARAGIADLHFHDLRHEAGSRKLEAGWPVHAVQVWLGHADVATTSRYLNVRQMQLHELNERAQLRLVT